MANRYWRGGTGVWDSSDTSHWSASSGGAGGASVPTSSDDVFFDANSFSAGGQIVAIDDGVTAACNSMNWTGATNIPTLLLFSGSGTTQLEISGSLTLIAGMSLTSSSTSNTISLIATSSGKTVTFGTQTIPCQVRFNGSGGGWALQDGVVLAQDSAVVFADGTVTTNNVSFTLPNRCTFQVSGGVINLGASVISLSTSASDSVEFRYDSGTINAGTSTIIFSNTGVGFCILRNNSAVAYSSVIFGSGFYFTTGDWSFAGTLTLGAGSNGQFGFGSTITGGIFVATGTSSSHAILDSDDPGISTFTLNASSTTIAYLDVADSVAGGAAIPFVDAGGIDNGNNTNWSFVAGGPSPTFNNTPGAYNPTPFGNEADSQRPHGSDVLQQKPISNSINTGKPQLS